MLKLLVFTIYFTTSLAVKRGCENVPSKANWTCEDYKYFLSQKNLETTLNCIEYDVKEKPSHPTEFQVGRSFERLLEINEKAMTISFEEAFAYAYQDDRLKSDCDFQHTYINTVPFWWPQAVKVTNMIKFEFMSAETNRFPFSTLESNGQFLMLSKGAMTIHCDFAFDWFPFDIHTCHASEEIRDGNVIMRPFDWANLKNHWFFFKTNTTVFHALWDIELSTKGPYNSTIYGEHVQSISLTFHLRRKINEHILHTFVPSFMLCVASTIAIFIPYSLFAPRMGLSVTSCLSMITLFNGAKNSWPTSVVAMRTWVVLCYITVFSILIEYCLALALIKTPDPDGANPMLTSRKWGQRLEKVSRVMAPLYLIIFNITFFTVCMYTYCTWK